LKPLPDDKYIGNLVTLLKENDEELRRIASSEIVNMSRMYLVPSNSQLFEYLEKNLEKEKDRTVLVDLLEVLRTMATKSANTVTWIRTALIKPLSNFANSGEGTIDNRVTNLTLSILLMLYEGEIRYKMLIDYYDKYLNNNLPMARTVLGLILEKHPEKSTEFRQHIIDLLKIASPEKRAILKDHLTQLR
jgi:hypothetical protein